MIEGRTRPLYIDELELTTVRGLYNILRAYTIRGEE